MCRTFTSGTGSNLFLSLAPSASTERRIVSSALTDVFFTGVIHDSTTERSHMLQFVYLAKAISVFYVE
ncbi:hypothetical protein P879_11069 [Paragonimus westermani]|uniref:Uncharacterized protein n=1 Tax=Paragonimus westermani TaxID=34504 RepID=A0A8T0DBM2_9TREM|nr:hypothetical protein P879_11069 [Paragonimus westermani]